MAKRLYIGNLSFDTSEDTLKKTFETDSVTMPVNEQGRLKGFAFADVPEEKADELIEKWNKKELDGREIVVNEARPREDRPKRYGGGGYNQDNRGGGGGNRYGSNYR